MSGRLAHEIAHHDQFPLYYAAQLPTRLNEENMTQIYKELGLKCAKCLTFRTDYIQKSQTLKTIYLEILRDYEYEHNIVINDDTP